jgi:ferredoxin
LRRAGGGLILDLGEAAAKAEERFGNMSESELSGLGGEAPGALVREIAEIDPELCDGCGQCLPNCAEGAIKIVNGKATLSDSLCDGLGACLAHCPKSAVRIVRRLSAPFDHEAAMAQMAPAGRPGGLPMGPGACPGASARAFPAGKIGNWPIQLALVSPQSPAFDSEVLVWAADCAAAAADEFRQIFVGGGRPLVLGCPKLDDKSLYEIKMGVVLKGSRKIRELWLPIMSVPCCRGLWRLAAKALERSGRSDVALRGWVFSPDGGTLERGVDPLAPREVA